MRKTANYFSFSFYKDTLQRLLVPIIVALCVATFNSTSTALIILFEYIFESTSLSYVTSLTFFDLNSMATVLVTVFMPIITVQAYSFLMKRHDADFYEALPIRRCTMLVSGALALFSAAAVILVVSTAVPLLVLIPCYGSAVTVSFGRVLLSLLASLIVAAMAISASLVSVSVTGKTVNAILVSYLLLCAPRLIMALVNLSLEMHNPMLVNGHIITFFNNEYNLFTAFIMGETKALSSVVPYLYSLLLAALCFAAAIYLFGRRKSEFATHAYANKYVRHAVRITLCTIAVLFGVFLICVDALITVLAVFLFIFVIAGYFISSAVEARKEKNFISSLKAFPIFIGVNVLLVLTIVFSNLTLSAYTPTKDEIKSASVVVSGGQDYFNFDQYVDLRSENILITDERVREIVADALLRGVDVDRIYTYNAITVKVNTKWSSAYRCVYLTDDEYAEINMARSLDDDYESLWLSIFDGAENTYIYSNGITIQGDAMDEIAAVMQSEINRIGFANWYSYYMYEEAVAYIDYTVYHGGKTIYVTLPIPESLSETVAKYNEEYARARLDMYNNIKDALYDAVSDADGMNVYLYYWTDTDYYEIDEQICKENENSKAIVDGIFALISPEAFELHEKTVDINCYSNGFSGESFYGSFAVADGVDEAQIVEFFKSYGYSYY